MADSPRNPYSSVHEQLIAECEVLPTGVTREECCEKQEIPMIECPEAYVPVERSFWDQHGEEVGMISGIIIALIITSIFAARWHKRASRSQRRSATAVLIGWILWVAGVTVVVLLFQPYGSRMFESDYINMALWFTLPPLLFLSVFWWCKRFFKSEE